ncbi:hypothetical protein I3843_10G154700 [Carya illinoinensis]|uniref:Uncharacterized protein n=1 Tax=Carya illinoinensis TaxID=32201 RepID=A0A922DZB1_CARIL|nr:hypothetical protein I3842_10G160200 [Carya illinoinensis]KAG7960957.1 hypothetical protein I3843_10G154700 [Carya illinoinensis]
MSSQLGRNVPTPTAHAAQFANPLPVISTQYCTPHPLNLVVVNKVMTISDGDFVNVIDTNNTIIFKVKGKLVTLHGHRVLLDAAGNPIVTVRKKRMTAHHRWNVYRGESKKSSDMIFTVRRSSRIQLKAKLHVFLANNTKEDVCDFIVYAKDRTNIVVEMSKETTVGSVMIGKDNYSVTIHPNVDYAFMVTLIVILDDMNLINDMDGVANNSGMTMAGPPIVRAKQLGPVCGSGFGPTSANKTSQHSIPTSKEEVGIEV